MVRHTIRHCCRSTGPRDTPATHIWVSDDVLTAQWTRFVHSSRSYTTISTRPSRRAQSAQQRDRTHIDIISKSGPRLVNRNNAIYQSQRHGSATPGPLEARRRRALQRHMTGASNLGMFGSGLDFSDSSWQNRVVRKDTLYDTLRMIWRWWLLDPDAPIRNEEYTAPVVQDTPQMDSFATLLQDLDIWWSQKPTSISELLLASFRMDGSNCMDLVKRTCSWIQAEIALGAMEERTIKTVLWDMEQLMLRRHYAFSVRDSHHVSMVYESVAEGLLASTIRPVGYLDPQTTWLALRCFATTCSQRLQSLDYCINIINRMAQEQPVVASQMLTATAQMSIPTSVGLPSTHFMEMFNRLPFSVSGPALLEFIPFLIRGCQLKKDYHSQQTLITFLGQLSGSDLLEKIRTRSHMYKRRVEFEHDLLKLGTQYVIAYLRHTSEKHVCMYMIKHLVIGIAPSGSFGQRVQHPRFMSDETKYESLLNYTQKYYPQRFTGAIKFLYQFLRASGRFEECHVLHRLCAKKFPSGRPSVEFIQNEATLWAEKSPIFALLLLAVDRRPGMLHHPIVAKTLAMDTLEFDKVPIEMLSIFVTSLTRTHKEMLENAALRNQSQSQLSRLHGPILQLLLARIAESQFDEKQAFRIAESTVKLLDLCPDSIRKDFAVTCTKIVAIKTLEARRKIARFRLIWLSHVIIRLEGLEAWMQTFEMIKQWWRIILAEENSSGRMWKQGVGWMSKEEEAETEAQVKARQIQQDEEDDSPDLTGRIRKDMYEYWGEHREEKLRSGIFASTQHAVSAK